MIDVSPQQLPVVRRPDVLPIDRRVVGIAAWWRLLGTAREGKVASRTQS